MDWAENDRPAARNGGRTEGDLGDYFFLVLAVVSWL